VKLFQIVFKSSEDWQ